MRESMLTQAEKDAIVIENFIFHIIIKDEVNPRFLDAVEISEEQKNFFKDRLADAAQGRQYVFTAVSTMKPLVGQILQANSENFVRLSKTIATQFKATHSNSTNSGVFIISTATTLNNRKLLFLVKLDHKKIYQYQVENDRALLQEVQDTFTEDKSAIQKVALIDVDNNVSWDVLVFDRGSKAEKGNITDYFKNFLGVEVRETESDLTLKAFKSANEWARENRGLLAPNQKPTTYKNRAKIYLLNHDVFNTEQFVDSVIQDEDANRRDLLKASFLRHINRIGLANQDFSIKPGSINKAANKNIRKTAEGVTIEWEGEDRNCNIEISNTPDADGMYTIKIKTSDIINVQ